MTQTNEKLHQIAPTILVIFGGAGDLSWRKLFPALFSLYCSGWLPENFAIVAADKKSMSLEEYREHIRNGIETFATEYDSSLWSCFSEKIESYLVADLSEEAFYESLKHTLQQIATKWDSAPNWIFYLAISPTLIKTVVTHIGIAQLSEAPRESRIVVEKPYGHDLKSANELDQCLGKVFKESQIFRIDHYLGKETVQNILALRFSNAWWEPIWDSRYIDHVQITVAEEVGVEQRGEYYEHAGALRDMVQNHMLQLLCLIAMEPPVSFDSDEIRNKKVDVLHAVRKISVDEVHQVAVRGQYGRGWIRGKEVVAYREEPGVKPDSSTETFAAIKLFVDNWRWQNVPFYLRTGKRLAKRVTQIVVTLKPIPHQAFPPRALDQWLPNRMILNIQPEESISLVFHAKIPGPVIRLSPVNLQFKYQEAFKKGSPEAYETLLRDVIIGDGTLFMRADQAQAAWSIVDPILEFWQSTPPIDFPNYPAGSWGPEAAQVLIAKDGKSWYEGGF